MGYREALEDNIPVKQGRGYYPPCHICGASVFSMQYQRGLKYTCPDCKQYLVESKILNNELPKKEKKLKEAIKRISKVSDIKSYERAIGIVRHKLSQPGWFQSTEEIMVALELIRRGVKAKHQVKIYNYSVDYVLPELKVALEIDGPMHKVHGHNKEEAIRDELITSALGEGFQLIRIPTDDINLNVTKLLPAIRAVLKYRGC